MSPRRVGRFCTALTISINDKPAVELEERGYSGRDVPGQGGGLIIIRETVVVECAIAAVLSVLIGGITVGNMVLVNARAAHYLEMHEAGIELNYVRL